MKLILAAVIAFIAFLVVVYRPVTLTILPEPRDSDEWVTFA